MRRASIALKRFLTESLAKAFALRQLQKAASFALFERENIGGCFDQTIMEKLLDELVAKSLDIESIAGGEML